MLWNQFDQETVAIGWTFYGPVLFFVVLITLGVPIWAAIGAAAVTMLAVSEVLPLSLLGESLFDGIDHFALTAVPLFILTGDVLVRTGLSRRFLDVAEALTCWAKGGFGSATVLVCGMFSAISGSDAAGAAAVGRMTIARLVESGYPRPYACALVAAGACTGILIPPSIAYIVIGLVLGISASTLFQAALIPGVLILLSILVFSLLQWLVMPVSAMYGYQQAGFPWSRTQAVGAMIVLGLNFVWSARDRLKEVYRKAVHGDPTVDDSNEPLSYRTAFWGTLVSLAVLVGFPIAYGVSWWPALIYFVIGTLFVIAYAHNRAETGLPIVWGYPIEEQNLVLPNFLGSQPLIGTGRLRSFTLLSMLNFYQRGTWYAINSTGQESCIVGETVGLGARRTTKLLFVAMVIGLVSAFWMYLACYNTYGGNIMETVGGTAGGQRVQIAMNVFQRVSRWVDQPAGPNAEMIGATLTGAFITAALIVIRRYFFRFPLHPVGFFFACCHNNYMWFPALVILTARAIVTRIGGARLYRRLAPAFYALTLGHFFSIGVWSFVGLFAGDQVQRYRVWFL